MSTADASARPRTVLVAGGGAAAIEAALALTAIPGDRLRVELVTEETPWLYKPLSVVEPFAGAPRTYAIDALKARGVKIHRDTLVAVNSAQGTVRLSSRTKLGYDALLVATGTDSEPAVGHATSALDTDRLHGLVQDVEGGFCRRVAFVAPPGAGWTLPLYELALQLAERAHDLCLDSVELTVVTHEQRPLEAFGPHASDLVEKLLDDANVRLVLGAVPDVPSTGRIVARPGEAALEVDRIVAMPIAQARPIPGLPSTDQGFIPVDEHGRVHGVGCVYAAGDVTDRPLKQGGLATQQADAAAAAIAADAGLPVDAVPFNPVLRGLLIAGSTCWFLRRELATDSEGTASRQPLWWPPTKIAGLHLTPFLDRLDAEGGHQLLERRLAGHGA
jgi:sulfide:quinone oxidoreductase